MRNEANDLRKKALLGLLRVALFLGLLLFLPAWSLRFWQAWLYWAVFCASILCMNLYFLKHDPSLIQRRLRAGPGAEREKSQKVIQGIASVLVIAVGLVAAFDHRFHWSSLPVFVAVSGNAVVLMGFFVAFRVFKENTFTASTIKVEAEQRVISTGPYAWIRHPLYAGTLLMLLATPFALGSLWTFVPVALVIGAMIARLLEEERYLKVNLSGYAAYCQTVRYRLIPAVW